MEIRAYNEMYVESAQNVLGHMFDFAINEVGLKPDTFASVFALSGISKSVENGNPRYVAGMTGPELVILVLEEANYPIDIPKEVMYADRSKEYWGGWAIAYYQWLRNKPFAYIFKAVPFSQLLKMYNTFHEMDMEKFIEEMDRRISAFYPDTSLKRRRELWGLSQRELATASGVPIRQIQLFEQRQRDINKTQAETLLKLSKVLGCSVEELME